MSRQDTNTLEVVVKIMYNTTVTCMCMDIERGGGVVSVYMHMIMLVSSSYQHFDIALVSSMMSK